MNFADLIHQQINNAFQNILVPGGLTLDVTFKYFVSAGDYDPETDTTNPVFNDVAGVDVVETKITVDDMAEYAVLKTDKKLIVPGQYIPQDLEPEVDRVTYNSETWHIRKTVGVPGRGVFIVFIYRT